MSETCERCYRELEPGDEKFCKWCRRYNVVSDEAWLLRRQLAAVVAERDAARAALAGLAAAQAEASALRATLAEILDYAEWYEPSAVAWRNADVWAAETPDEATRLYSEIMPVQKAKYEAAMKAARELVAGTPGKVAGDG